MPAIEKPIYKVLEYIRDTKDRDNADILNEMRGWIADEFPETFEQFESDNYDGPPDGEAWSGGIADNH